MKKILNVLGKQSIPYKVWNFKGRLYYRPIEQHLFPCLVREEDNGLCGFLPGAPIVGCWVRLYEDYKEYWQDCYTTYKALYVLAEDYERALKALRFEGIDLQSQSQKFGNIGKDTEKIIREIIRRLSIANIGALCDVLDALSRVPEYED